MINNLQEKYDEVDEVYTNEALRPKLLPYVVVQKCIPLIEGYIATRDA